MSKLIGVIGSGSATTYAPLIVYEGSEDIVREESLVLIRDEARNLTYLGILRYLKRLEPFLNPWQRTSYVDEPSLVDSGTFPHTTGYVYIIGTIGNDGRLSTPVIPPNPGSKVYLIERADDIRLNLGSGLLIGSHKYSGIEVPLSYSALRYHILVVGATGTGKSRLVTALIREVINKSSWNVIVFDHSGLDYVPFFKEYVVSASDIVLDPLLIADNIARVGNVSNDRYLTDYITLASLTYSLCMSIKYLEEVPEELDEIMSKCKRVATECQASQGEIRGLSSVVDLDKVIDLMAISKLTWNRKCFRDLLISIAKSMGARESTLVRLSVITDLWLGDTFFKRLSNRYLLAKDLINKVFNDRLIVVDLSNEDNIVRRYIVTYMLKALWDLIDSERREVNTLIVIDEAHNYACRTCKPSVDLIARTAREGRKWGLGLVLVTQRAIDVDPDIRNNINTVLFSKLQTPSDYENISSFMSLAGLKSEYLMTLDKREFFLAGLGNPLKIPILIKVVEVK